MVIPEAGWYYSLSTIPQTLAAMITLAATFIIFKLSHIKNTIRADLPLAKWFLLAIDSPRYGTTVLTMSKHAVAHRFSEEIVTIGKEAEAGTLSRERWHTIWNEFSNIVDDSHRSFASHPERMIFFLQQKARSLEKNIVSGERVFSYLIWSIFFTATPIVFSLIFLPLYQIVSGSFFIVAGAVVLAIWGVLYTSYSVWKISPI